MLSPGNDSQQKSSFLDILTETTGLEAQGPKLLVFMSKVPQIPFVKHFC